MKLLDPRNRKGNVELGQFKRPLTRHHDAARVAIRMFTALDFFAGSGLVRLGLTPEFQTVWANDNSVKKRDTYTANHPWGEFLTSDIQLVRGQDIPTADLAWASFPCQDLSLAGNLGGIKSGTRSGLFWDWVRILREMQEDGKKPPILVAENVVGFVVAA
jgi:DNA (cytosine-5)-methyltransferase 1